MGKGKTYLVSGSSRGVGLALVKELLSKMDERTVFAAARSPQKSEELQKLAKEHKERLHIIVFDVTSGDSAKVCPWNFDHMSALHNRIDHINAYVHFTLTPACHASHVKVGAVTGSCSASREDLGRQGA